MKSPFNHRRPASVLGAWLLVFVMSAIAAAGTPSPPARILEDAPQEYRDQFMTRHPAPYPVSKRPGLYNSTDWATAIDSVWGPGLSWDQHKLIWETFWHGTDSIFACFPGLDSSIWQDVWDQYYPEILDTVSRGRLDAIVKWSDVALREAHVKATDVAVITTALEPGVPLFVVGGWGVVDHFGAGLTSLPDSTLLVYSVADAHPLGLVPGDLVLGYDGVPWKELYPQLMAAQLPLTGTWLGSCPKSFTESFLTAAGMNWHLFDTIDVVKYGSGDTVHLPTNLLVGTDLSLVASEQLPVPGVSRPDFAAGDLTSWGVITGTKVGYIYSMGWFPHSDSALIINAWLRALDSLKNVYHVSGVILDFRTNFGTQLSFMKVLDYLFDTSGQVLESDKRCGPGHWDLCLETNPIWRNMTYIPGTINTHWDRPLAILTGPGAASGGDIYPLMLSRHPLAKVFGKPSAGAFSGAQSLPIYPGWSGLITDHNFYFAGQPGEYLARKEFPSAADFPWVDYQPVWLTRDGVANGIDDVVEAAKSWIQSRDVDGDGVINENDNCSGAFNPAQEDLDSNGVGDSCECSIVVVAKTGDVNVSGSITSSDIIVLVNYVFKGGATPSPCAAAGDVNCSGAITSADLIGLVNYVFKAGTPPCDVCTLIPGLWTCP